MYIQMPYGVIKQSQSKPFFNTLPEQTETQITSMNEYLGISLKRTTYAYNKFDAIDTENKTLLECKHRTVYHNTYDTTIIGLNKYSVYLAQYPDWDFYVSFLFRDGLYIYQFDKTKTLDEQGLYTSTKKYNKMITNGFVKEHINIPITKLVKIADGF